MYPTPFPKNKTRKHELPIFSLAFGLAPVPLDAGHDLRVSKPWVPVWIRICGQSVLAMELGALVEMGLVKVRVGIGQRREEVVERETEESEKEVQEQIACAD
jgi:hypothetical protein